MNLTISIEDTVLLVDALQAVDAAITDPSRATDALLLARDVLSTITVRVEEVEEDAAVERQWLGWVR